MAKLAEERRNVRQRIRDDGGGIFAMKRLLAACVSFAAAVGVVIAVLMVTGTGCAHAHAGRDVISAAQLSASPWQARPFYGHRLEPQEDVVLQGAGQSDSESFLAYSHAVGAAQPMLFMTYVDLHDDLPAYFARLNKQLAALPFFVVPQIGLALNQGDAAKHYEAQVLLGREDAHLQQFCEGLRSLGRPAFVRPGYEFNGPWNGYQPAAYAAAFRRIVTKTRSCAGDSVAFVWDISAGAQMDRGDSDTAAKQSWSAYYPGDAFVDWWGINLFAAQELTSDATQAFLAEAAARKFPVMIAESTSLHQPASDGQKTVDGWFAPYFGLIRRTPNIRAFCYIDWDWAKYPQWADWGDDRIETDPTVLSFYKSQIASPHVASARTPKSTFTLLRAR
jgi:hypothetical protein